MALLDHQLMQGKHINTLIAATIASTFPSANTDDLLLVLSLYKAPLCEAYNTATHTSFLSLQSISANFPAERWRLPRRRDEHSLEAQSEFPERYTTPPRCFVQLPFSELHIAVTSRPPKPCRGQRSLVAQSLRSAVAMVAGNLQRPRPQPSQGLTD